MSLLLRRLDYHFKNGKGSRLITQRCLSGWNGDSREESMSTNQNTQRFSVNLTRRDKYPIKNFLFPFPPHYHTIRWNSVNIPTGLCEFRYHHTQTQHWMRPSSSLNYLVGIHKVQQLPFLYSSLRPLSNQVTTSSENPSKAQSLETKVSSTDSLAKSQTIVKQVSSAPDKNIFAKIGDSLIGAGKATVSFIAKIPGVLWFYITHSKERHEKWIEIKDAAKKEAHHYWMGTKLLAADIRTARVLVARTLRGSSLSRRERKQLQRTVTDIFRLVPFSVFVIVPFMEFTLPFFLRLFPNMLPSTYQDSLKEEEDMMRELKSRLAMAEFFQESLQTLANEQKKAALARLENKKEISSSGETSSDESAREHSAESFLEFLEKARNGEMIPAEVIIRYSTYFKDEMTLDNMPRMQLINMCKYMNIPPYGSDNLLRLQLRHRVKALREDDQKIIWEGMDSLTKMELREACRERGMRSTGLSKESYKRALQQWIELSVNRNVPVSLLIMSRIFFLQDEDAYRYPQGAKHVGGLADAITGMDKEVINEVVLDVATSKEKTSNTDVLQIKLDVLQQQNEMIAEEKKAREATAAKMAEKELDKAAKEDALKPLQQEKLETVLVSPREIVIASDMNIKDDAGTVTIPADIFRAQTEALVENDGSKETQLSSKEIDAIKHLLSPDPVSAEREKLERLKAAIQDESKPSTDDSVPAESTRESASIQSDNVQSTMASDESTKKELQTATMDTESLSLRISDKEAVDFIKASDDKVEKESSEMNIITSGVQSDTSSVTGQSVSTADAGTTETAAVDVDAKLDKAISRLKSKVESMLGKLEIQLDNVEKKIGDKLHYLDKDMDGILSREEVALCLQSVLKRPLSFDEAMAIAKDMDENEDGYFSLEELSKWLETNKLVKLVKEGKEDEVERLIAEQTLKQSRVEGVQQGPSGQNENIAAGGGTTG